MQLLRIAVLRATRMNFTDEYVDAEIVAGGQRAGHGAVRGWQRAFRRPTPT